MKFFLILCLYIAFSILDAIALFFLKTSNFLFRFSEGLAKLAEGLLPNDKN